ncbi:MAG: L-arabinose isomerase [Verrucomicrobiota bacterium JB022]|nr:L-arabinose isomerase [Verrucomicrobiota bacterium JB022]
MKLAPKALEFWFVTGSQHLYGPEALRQVSNHSQQIVEALNAGGKLPTNLTFKALLVTPDSIRDLVREANANPQCAGLVAWMHTFSPAKMWIGGLTHLQKPMLHLHTQFNRDLPWDTIDMDFMNLNQAAHGDREFGFMNARLRRPHSVVAGFWGEEETQVRMAEWMRAAGAWQEWQGAKFCRFGDNMRQVAVTDGDKVAAEARFGFTVDGYGIGDLVDVVNQIADSEVDRLCAEYEELYNVVPALRKGGDRHQSLRTEARVEAGLRQFMQAGNYSGFTTTFEDLHGLSQLPGMAPQRLMGDGYGFAGEGDWKTAALVRAMKVMAHGLPEGASFMEDYTYHMEPGNEMVLGSHMLEICPSIASGKPNIEIHPLGIGGKDDPVRMVFNSPAGRGLNASIVDVGNRFRLIVNAVDAIEPPADLPKLPVARAVWKPLPDFRTGLEGWIIAGGAHHTGYTCAYSPKVLEHFAEMAGIEYLLIGEDTKLDAFRDKVRWNDLYYTLASRQGH